MGVKTASGSDNRVGPCDRPERPRLLESLRDKGPTSRFDNSRPDEDPLRAKVPVTHARGILAEVVHLRHSLAPPFTTPGKFLRRLLEKSMDIALVQQLRPRRLPRGFLPFREQQLSEVVQVLSCMISRSS